MYRVLLSCRAMFVALLMLGLAAPPMQMPIAPSWLVNAICLAPDSSAPSDHRQPAKLHTHCALCLTGLALFTPPSPVRLPVRAAMAAAVPVADVVAWAGPGASRAYASRAPPGIV
jgi:hypothetical protein